MQKIKENSLVLFLIGGIFSLVISIGIGRFAYTPLLSLMEIEFNLSKDIAGFLASANYLGYLTGTLLCIFFSNTKNRLLYFRFYLFVNIATTTGMGLVSSIEAMYAIRFITGIASGAVYVIGSAIVLDKLASMNKSNLNGIVFSGVGLGIAFTAIITLFLEQYFNSSGLWIAMGILSFILGIGCWIWVGDDHKSFQKIELNKQVNPQSENKFLLYCLLFAYFSEGFGYIISGTFIVSILKDSLNSPSAANFVWLILGLSASVSTILWVNISKKMGLIRTIIFAHLIQSVGIILPVLFDNIVSAYIGAVLFGGTFMGIVVLSFTLGKKLNPDRSVWIISRLTAVFGLGQIIGPIMAGIIAEKMNSFYLPLIISAIVVTFGAFVLFLSDLRCNTITLEGKIYCKK